MLWACRTLNSPVIRYERGLASLGDGQGQGLAGSAASAAQIAGVFRLEC
jgi:hypothetical protein